MRPLTTRRLAPLLLALTLTPLLEACATRPIMLEDRPAADATLASSVVRFQWRVAEQHGEEFVGYHLQVAKGLSFAAPVHNQEYPEPHAEVILAPGSYYWRVKGRYRKMGDAIEETGWSDMKLIEGRHVQRARIVTVLDPGTPTAASGAPAGPPEAEATTRRRAGPRPGAETVVPAHERKPSFEGMETVGVAAVLVEGKENPPLTRELILRLFTLGRFTLLEQQLVDDGELRIPMAFLDAAGRPKELPSERSRVFLLHRQQATPMLADNAVRLKGPDVMLIVRIGNLAMDPALLPRPPARPRAPRPDFARFESGTRVLNATLVSLKSGIILWTASLYGLPDVADLTLVASLVQRYFE